MDGRNNSKAWATMSDTDNDVIMIVTERFERRVTEETGKLRVEMATDFGRVRTDIAAGFGSLRAEMADRNAALLRWLLLFGVTQTAALAGLVRLWT
jgi:hypothetical protein